MGGILSKVKGYVKGTPKRVAPHRNISICPITEHPTENDDSDINTDVAAENLFQAIELHQEVRVSVPLILSQAIHFVLLKYGRSWAVP